MEFKEYSNPLEKDYDIKSSMESSVTEEDIYSEQLVGLIGLLEDVKEEELLNMYGITFDEYFHPTEDTVAKVMDAIQMNEGFSRGRSK